MPKQATTVSGDLPEKAEPKWLNEEEREGWLFISSIIFNLTRQLDNQLQQDADLSYKKGPSVYKVETVNNIQKYEVRVDANSGQVLSSHIDL